MPFAENVFVSTTSSVDHADIAQYHGVVEVLRDRFQARPAGKTGVTGPDVTGPSVSHLERPSHPKALQWRWAKLLGDWNM